MTFLWFKNAISTGITTNTYVISGNAVAGDSLKCQERTYDGYDYSNYINSTAVTVGTSCTYSGTGNWIVTISDNCTLSTNLNLGENNLTLSGNEGQFRILTSNFTYSNIFFKCQNCHYIRETTAREVRLK
jgi:hypothetical protein